MPLLRNKFPSVRSTPYDTLRPQLCSGDVLLCSGSGVFSTLIQRATDSVWSHIGLILRVDAIDRVLLLESVEPVGVRTIRMSKYLTDYDNQGNPYPGKLAVLRHQSAAILQADPGGDRGAGISAPKALDMEESTDTDAATQNPVSRIPYPESAPKALADLARCAVDKFGYPYDKQQIAIIAARIAANRLGFSRRERERLDRPGAYICSEYVALCFEEIGIEIPWSRKGFIAPADFACADCFDLVGVMRP